MRSSAMAGSDMAHRLRELFAARAAWAWLAGLVVCHGIVELCGGAAAVPEWFRWFGLSREGVIAGKIWQPLSYGALHGNWPHLLINCTLLLVIGSRVERMLGGRVFSWVALASVVSGGLFHLLLGSGLLVGISGACVGMLLVLTTLSPQSRMFPLPVSAKSLGLGILLAELVMTLMQPWLDLPFFAELGRMIDDAGGGLWFQIGHACHLGGGIGGWLAGRWILRPRVSLAKLRSDRSRREARPR